MKRGGVRAQLESFIFTTRFVVASPKPFLPVPSELVSVLFDPVQDGFVTQIPTLSFRFDPLVFQDLLTSAIGGVPL